MTAKPVDERDIQQDEYINDVPAMKVIAFGKVSAGVFKELLVNSSGQLL